MSTHIFYAPHQDDETIGMGGHIAEAVAAGDRVKLVLLTSGEPSTRAETLFTGGMVCPVHNCRHGHDMEAVWRSRSAEFDAAAAALGVTNIEVCGLDEHDPLLRDRMGDVIMRNVAAYPDAMHHVTMGPDDAVEGLTQNAHATAWRAGMLAAAAGAAVLFHWVYLYRLPPKQRSALAVPVPLAEAAAAVKRRAAAEYRRWDPDGGRFAFGYHSVADLFDAIDHEPVEYVSGT